MGDVVTIQKFLPGMDSILLLNTESCLLVKGYGYKSGKHTSNFMEYIGLLEGMIWARRLDTKEIEVHGDSELIINQISGEYNANNPKLRKCRGAFPSSVRAADKGGTGQGDSWIPLDDNGEADKLANQGMDRMENKTVVNWQNVNKLMATRHDIIYHLTSQRQYYSALLAS